MRLFCFLVFIGVFLTRNVILSLHRKHPTHLESLFGLTDSNDTKTKENSPNVCKTQECDKLGKELANNIDKSVDPCDNFYEYACGKWPENNPIPEGYTSWSLFQAGQKQVDDRVQEILNAGPQENDVLGVKLAKKWYATCTDTDAMEKQGIEPIIYTLARIGGWPMIMDPDEWDEQEYNWQKVDDQYMRLTGRNNFHDVRVGRDYSSNDTSKIVMIDTPHLPPGAYQLWIGGILDSFENLSDEDPSDENKQSDEDNEVPGSEGSETEDDDDDDDNDDNDDDDDNDVDDDDDYDDDDEDESAKKKISTKKNRIARKRNRKSEHHGKKKKNVRPSIKHSSHKVKKQRTKRQANMAKAFKKLTRINHRGVLRARLNKKKRLNKIRKVGSTETSDEPTKATTTSAPQITTIEETSEEIDWNTREDYANYISEVARALAKGRHTGVPEDHIDKDIQDMIEFQIKLTDLTLEADDDLEMTLDDFQNWYDEQNPKTDHSEINWVYKIAEIFDEASVPVDGDLDVQVGSSDYFKGLISLLDETPSRVIVNYIHWNFVSQVIRTTTKKMRKLYKKWENEDVEEETEKERRSSECKWEIEEMGDILAYEYVRKHFSDNITQTAQDMVDDIQKEVEYQIKESDWMDEDTKDYVLAKLLNMKQYIGYPEWYKNDTIIKRYFQGLIICNSYYENALSYGRYGKWKSLRKLIKDDDDMDIWWMSPLVVNAFFDPMENSITIMAADFQSPFFAYGRPQAINYGIIGVIMGHEVNHGFDNDGVLFDKNGRFVDWLSAMADAYGKRAECFVEQYNNYEIDKEGTKIRDYGNKTAGENIADTMGLIAAYRAYLRRERECERPDTVLPGLENITNDQLFFLSFANIWCEVDDDVGITAAFDSHSTGRLRVIGTLSNSEDFAKAFNCPVGSPMNPEKKCNIWK
ncbi:neprilysin-1-like [Pseudomyrmex gracilis]|uniref:neprilysin-1-like n=1 Tax=Pseudomyrmex gracilis TaxID=219809 RepID=UPI000995CB23|nr:neprilysin-1-like [Pseudomyrmex gracilis]